MPSARHTATQITILERGLEALRAAEPEVCAMDAFNANISACGTTHCIGGWLAVANNMTVTQVSAAFDWTDYWSSPIADLFYMWHHSIYAFDRRPATERKKLMLIALENFIRTGSPGWSGIFDEYPEQELGVPDTD